MILFRLVAVILAFFFAASGQEPSPVLAGIAHVAFRVSDVPRSREFYRALGFEEAFAFADPGKPPVSYIKVNDRQFIELYGRADDSQPLGLMHVCYETAGIESLWSAYTRRGVNAPQPRKARAGNLLFLLRDPENRIVEYTQYLPGSLHSEDRGKHLGERRISRRLIAAAMPVNDVSAELSFFVGTLGFQQAGGPDSIRLPGDSAEELQLEPAASKPKTRIVFAVSDPISAAAELRRRSLTVTSARDSAAVADPDGVLVVFARGNDVGKSPKDSKE